MMLLASHLRWTYYARIIRLMRPMQMTRWTLHHCHQL